MALKSIQQAANTWGVSVYTVRRLAAAGLVRTVTVARRRLVSENEIERIMARGVPGAGTDKEPGRSVPRKRRG
jgi:predicted site-specific integrase-resolvase